jgi:surface polysaccharide O-acyltransferase-like enzyme
MNKIKNNQRLLGIDLCRGIAAFAVVVVHSGDETWGIPVSYEALHFRLFFYFAVPFFLATSFFFITRNLSENIDLNFLRIKLQRIFIPYCVWSILYIFFGTIFSFLANQPDKLNQLFQDPLSTIFFGGASYHLYFLPLLLSGTSLIFLLKNLLKHKFKIPIMIILSIISMIINRVIALSGNSFQLNPNTAFSGLLGLLDANSIYYSLARFLVVEMDWILICLPYFCIAVILNHILLKSDPFIFKSKFLFFWFLSIFIYFDIFSGIFMLPELSNIIMAFSLLFVGICLSNHLQESRIIKSLGNCSFGIYLIHPIIKKITGIILTFTASQITSQITVISMLCLSIPSFLISWLVINLLMNNKHLAQYMFGMRVN